MSAALLTALIALAQATPAPVTDQEFETRCRDAVLDLHVFFEEWFNARVPDSPESLARFRDVLADDFEYIGAAGYRFRKAQLFTSGTWPGHGYWTQEDRKGGKTRVENFEFRRISDTTAIATWEYWQDERFGDEAEPKSRGRFDTGVFRLDPSKPKGIEWLHVQETLLPGMEPR
ncbi:MAG: hypothetical protein AAGF23_00890 [Acidobacteriota bacterium]